MGKERSAGLSSFLEELVQVGVYKRNQGRVTRQVTLAALAIIVALGSWRFFHFIQLWTWNESLKLALPVALLLIGLWLAYRLINYPRFADFLIAVEAEMNKVSWPTRGELIRSSIVVLVVIITLAFVLFMYDIIWQAVFEWLEVTKTAKPD